MQGHHDTRDAKKARHANEDVTSKAAQLVTENRGHALTPEERLDILALHANLRKPALAVSKKESVTNTISRLLMRSNKTVGKVWTNFVNQEAVIVSDPPANRNQISTRIPRSVEMQAAVRGFIRSRCETRTRTTAKDVMHFLVESSFLYVDLTDPVRVKTALRQVQRLVHDAGYSRDEHKAAALKLSPQNDLKRAVYVQRMTTNELEHKRIVYMDESYIHQHYARHNDSLYDPTDDSSVKAKHKGRRLCFIAAIIDSDRSVEVNARAEHQQAQLLLETVDIFEGGKQTKDYHGMFHHDYFVKWMDTLLHCLAARSISGAVIVMDNAKYHKVLPPDTPKKGDKKSAFHIACQQYGLNVPPNASKSILWDDLSAHITKTAVPVVVEMVRAAGHEVVYTPPHHSDLQPIEIVWAIIKGEVGRQYTTSTTFADIRTRLDRAFRGIQPSTVQGCIDTANRQLLELKKHLGTMDEQSEFPDCDGDQLSESGSE